MTPKKVTMEDTEVPRLFVEPGLMKTLMEAAVRNVLESEVERRLGVEHYERSGERRGYRNGTKPRTMKTSIGKLHFDVPQVREGGFHTQVFDRYQRSDKALVGAMQEMVVAGVSTRDVAFVLEEMGGFEVSATTVSRTMAELDEQIESFFSRPLSECEYPYLIVDARYEKVRKSGRVVSQAVLIVTGIRDDGRRELLSLEWGGVFADLKKRGLRGVELIVSDAHRGIQSAIGKHFQGAEWQRCRVHFMRELMAKVSWKDHGELAADLRAIYASESAARCLEVAEEVAVRWEKKAPKMSSALREGVESTLVVWRLPRAERRKLNSTNMIERLMKEIKKRTRKVGAFPNESACRRLVGAVLLETQDRWDMKPQRYLVLDRLTF